MRFEQRIDFVTAKRKLNEIGDWVEETTVETKPAFITEMSNEKQKILFGTISDKVLTAVVLEPVREVYDYIMIDGEKYDTKEVKHLRYKTVFMLGGR